MHTVFALLCFVVVIHWLIFPYPSGLLHWHCGNLTIAPVLAKQPWWIWINTSCEFIMNDCITTTKQSTTKPCAYLLGYTVFCCTEYSNKATQIAKFMGPTWSPPGSCRPQMGPMLAPWTLLSGNDTVSHHLLLKFDLVTYHTDNFAQNMHNWHLKGIHFSFFREFCACVQPMRDGVTLQHRLSLAGSLHKMIHVSCESQWSNQCLIFALFQYKKNVFPGMDCHYKHKTVMKPS